MLLASLLSMEYTETMPRRSSKPKEHDFMTVARRVVEQAIGEKLDGSPIDNSQDSSKNPHAVALGRMGGLKGGKARAMALSAKERKLIAKKAASARWAVKDRESK